MKNDLLFLLVLSAAMIGDEDTHVTVACPISAS
jgi:hypothetical protein